METSKNIQGKLGGQDREDWGSDEDWQSENEWNEDSSMAGEETGVSEMTEDQQPEEDEGKKQKTEKQRKRRNPKAVKLNFNDVGTEDDGESRHPEDITERSDGKYPRTNASDITSFSDIEDEIAEAQLKFTDDRRSLSGVMEREDEVVRDENPSWRASETGLAVDTFKKEDEISFRSYSERMNLEDHIPQRDVDKITSGRIEYINYSEKDKPKPIQVGLGHIEYLENKSDSGSVISEQIDSSISKQVEHEDIENEKSENSGNVTEADSDLSLESKSESQSSGKSEKLLSKISNQPEDEGSASENKNDAECREEEEQVICERDDEEQLPEFKEFEEPECSKFGEKHLCCFVNLGGGGDGRGNELVNRLKKLKDDISNMRKELSLARQECKKESEEVALLIEAAAARNRAAEQSEVTTSNALQAVNVLNYTLEEIMPESLLVQLPGRNQVAIPTTLLEDRLRTTRQTASSTYRQSLNELERMVEKEMASIKDSMTRLEPLNKIAAEWETAPALRDPKRRTYKSDYRLEMVTSEMRLQAPEVTTSTIQGLI